MFDALELSAPNGASQFYTEREERKKNSTLHIYECNASHPDRFSSVNFKLDWRVGLLTGMAHYVTIRVRGSKDDTHFKLRLDQKLGVMCRSVLKSFLCPTQKG